MDLNSLVALPVPVPPTLEQALGYTGHARLVSFHWEPVGDEAMYDDGVLSGDAAWPAYLSYVQHPKVEPALRAYNLGSSECEARDFLVLDRVERKLYVLPARQARELLHQQWLTRPDAPPTVDSIEAVQALLENFTDEAGWEEVQVDMAEVERRMQAQGQLLEALVAWLDQA